MLAKLFGSAIYGVDAFRITVEVSVSNGLGYHITGLPDDAIKESLSRIEIAIKSNGYHMPRTKVVINLAPADIRKSGTAFDLPIALGVLLASDQITDIGKLNDYLLIGEMGLDGTLFPVRGALCMAYQARKDGFKGIVLPVVNAAEAALVGELEVFGISHICEAIAFINTDCAFEPVSGKHVIMSTPLDSSLDFKDVRGQPAVKRALEIAAAGGHNALLIGPPGGNGKTMLAKRLPSILPPMTLRESLETSRIYSVLRRDKAMTGLIQERPFRHPHHTASDVSLAGGGNYPTPGEISLAHNGVLFLDELPEFKRSAIEILRQPLEDRKVVIARAKYSTEFPANFILLAAMNPCLCGYFGHPVRHCTCSRRAVLWYRRRISGPLLERIDLQIDVDPVPWRDWTERKEQNECSMVIAQRVHAARTFQGIRFQGSSTISCNAQIADKNIDDYCSIDPIARKYLFNAKNKWQLSGRSVNRTFKIGRTIADLAGTEKIELEHIAEALHFRQFDKPLV